MKIRTGFIILGIIAALLLSWWFLSSGNGKHLGYVRIGIDTSWKPVQFYHREQNVTYFSEELLSAIGENQNFSMRFIHTEADFLFSGLLRGDFDAILSSIPIHSQYDLRDFIFSNIYFPLGPVIVASHASRIKSINDISGKKIGFIMGSEAAIPFSNTTIRFVPYDNDNLSKLIDDLLANNLDGAIIPAMLAYHYAERGIYQHQLEVVTHQLNNEGLGMIAKNSPQSKQLIKVFNDGLKALQENGTYNSLLQKWDFPVPKE